MSQCFKNSRNIQLAEMTFNPVDPWKNHRDTPKQVEPPIEGTPSNFVFKLTMLTVETLSCFAVKTA